VPLQVLYDNPKLIDADSADTVRKYLEPFRAAIDLSDNPDVEAFDVTDETDQELDSLLG